MTEGDGLNRSRGDVAQFARIRLTEEPELGPKLDPGLDVGTLVEAIQAKSEGNFLYVEYLLRGMLVRPGPIGLRSLDVWPAGLDGIYQEFLERALPRPTPERPKSPVVDTLAVAQEAVTEDQIARFTGAAVPSVRLVLSAIRQFLEVDETLPPRDRRFALYHQSFADFLLDGDRSDVWWCDQREHNGRLGQYYATTYRGRWEGSDEYGLRHVAYHLLNGPKGGLARLAGALDPSFIRTKVARFGSERSLLGDLDLALAAARTANNPALLLRFGWLHVGLRDRISQAVNAELLPFYVRLGQIERVLSMIDALDDRAGFYEWAEKTDSRRQVAVELARRGSVDRAIEIVEAIPDDGARDRGLCEVAEQVALHDGHLALEIAARGNFAVITTEFCRRLAGHADLLDRSIELAAGRGPVLEAIALEVAHRDFDRALALIDTIEPYDDERYPYRTKGPDASRALLAIAETNRKPDRAVSLFDQLEDAGEVLFALIGIAGARATVDSRGALDFVDHYEARDREKGGLAAHMEYRLGLASIAAASEDPEIQREVARRRDEWHNRDLADPGYHRRAAGLSPALYVIGRLEWAAFRHAARTGNRPSGTR